MTALTAATALSTAGFEVDLLDTYVDGLQRERFAEADVIGISIPLFDSLTAGVQVADEIRVVNPAAKIVFFGQYATINATRLAGTHGDCAIVGEWEMPFVHLLRGLREGACGAMEGAVGVVSADMARQGASLHPFMSRDHFRLPDRRFVPSLSKYPQPQLEKLIGSKQIV